MRSFVSQHPRWAVATVAVAVVLAASVVLVKPQVSHAFTLVESQAFFDPVDVAPGQFYRVRVSNLFGDQTVHVRIDLRSADDGSQISGNLAGAGGGIFFEGNLMPGQGVAPQLNGDGLPANAHAIIAVLTISGLAPGGGTLLPAIQMPASVQLVDQGTLRTIVIIQPSGMNHSK
jgi:hypothetical protein